VPYIVRDGQTALLVPPNDPEGMAAALLRVLTDPVLHQRLAQAGAQEVQRYTWEKVSPVLCAAYAAAMGRASGAITPRTTL
jgi:glycosyltransferase involved in cell wall biosynthesis